MKNTMTIKEKINMIRVFLDAINMATITGKYSQIKYIAFLKSLKWHIPTNWQISKKGENNV